MPLMSPAGVPTNSHRAALELHSEQAVELCCCLLREDIYMAKIISHDFKGQCGNWVVIFIFLSQI